MRPLRCARALVGSVPGGSLVRQLSACGQLVFTGLEITSITSKSHSQSNTNAAGGEMSASRLTRLATYALRPPTTTRTAAVDRMERTSAITHLMASLEHLANRHERRHGGMNDWSVTCGDDVGDPVRGHVTLLRHTSDVEFLALRQRAENIQGIGHDLRGGNRHDDQSRLRGHQTQCERVLRVRWNWPAARPTAVHGCMRAQFMDRHPPDGHRPHHGSVTPPSIRRLVRRGEWQHRRSAGN